MADPIALERYAIMRRDIARMDAQITGLEEDVERLTAERNRLRAAGDRIIALISRCSDQATDEQRAEHERQTAALRSIWTAALAATPAREPGRRRRALTATPPPAG